MRLVSCMILLNFNPRTRVGCDIIEPMINIWGAEFQSTHPRGVRLRTLDMSDAMEEFQSTHPRGVRRGHDPFRGAFGHFNPRTRVGCDDSSVRICSSSRFQSTHPRGVRLLCLRDDRPIRQFQSTHPRGVRLRCRQFRCRTCNFNPRTRVGCD